MTSIIDLSRVFTFTIADNDSLSDAVYIANHMLYEIEIPSTWVTATVITFQTAVADKGETPSFVDLYHDVSGTLTEYSVPVAASRHIRLDTSKFAGVRWLKIRSGATGSAVAQTENAGVILKVIGTPL